MSSHSTRVIEQLHHANTLYMRHPDPLLKSAIALLGESLGRDDLTPQQTRAYALVDNLRRAAAALYNDPEFLPDDVQEEW